MQTTQEGQEEMERTGRCPHLQTLVAEDMLGDPPLGILPPVRIPCTPKRFKKNDCIFLMQSLHPYLLPLVCAGLKIRQVFQPVRQLWRHFTMQRMFPKRPIPQRDLQDDNMLMKKSYQIADVFESLVLSWVSSLTTQQKFDIGLYMKAEAKSDQLQDC